MKRAELECLLPHRGNMLLLDEARTECVTEDGTDVIYACAKKTFSGSEWFFDGHFPGNPVVPGVIQCEILAQTVCVLMDAHDATPYFTGMNNVRWKRPVRPGETLETRCTITRAKKPFYFAKGEGRVNGELAVCAEFSFALK